jgi:hypothetical protein
MLVIKGLFQQAIPSSFSFLEDNHVEASAIEAVQWPNHRLRVMLRPIDVVASTHGEQQNMSAMAAFRAGSQPWEGAQ